MQRHGMKVHIILVASVQSLDKQCKLLHRSNVTGSKVRRLFEYQNIKHHEIRPNKGPTSNMKSQRYVGAKVSCPTPISRVCSLDTDKWSLMVTRVYSSHGVQSV